MPLLNSILVLLLLLNFFILGTSRIKAMIQGVALQGILLGILPIVVRHHVELHLLLICAATVAIKGIVIPAMLSRAMRELPIRREVEPIIGLAASMILGALGTALSIGFARGLPLIDGHAGGLLVPAALATVLTGFLILTTRHKAITQATGYLILENGIFVFGLLLIEAMPLLVELGVLLDLVVGIFVMGIIISHINREFDSVHTERLAALKE
jgi:hydrogenase-4 component E